MKKRKNNKNARGIVLFQWFISYLAIFLIPLLLSITVYFYSLHIIDNSAQENSRSALEQFRIALDSFMTEGFQIYQQITLNLDLQTLTKIRNNPQPEEAWTIIKSINEIKKIKSVHPMVDDILIAFNQQQTLMNSSVYLPRDFFYRLFYESKTWDRSAFTSLMEKPPMNKIVQVNDKLFLFRPSVQHIIDNNTVTLGVLYNKEIFDNYFFYPHEINGGKIFIVQTDNQLVYGSGENSALPFFSGNKGIIGKDRYYVLSLESRVMNWTYLYFIPESLQTAKARQIQFLTLAGLFICFFFGLFFSYKLSMRNYAPVRNLIKLLSGQEKPVKGENEFNLIERKIKDTQTLIGNNLKKLRTYYINSLLRKPFDPVNGRHEMERYNIKLNGEWNMVVIFTVNYPIAGRTLTESESESINSLIHEVIRLFTDVVPNVEMIDDGEHAVAIVNWSGDKDDFINHLEAKIEEFGEEAAQILHVPVLTAMGEPRMGLDGIFYSNMEAVETLKYLDPKSGQTTLHYHDIEYSNGIYSYSFEIEQKLVNLVRLGDSEAVCAILRQIWAENTANNQFGYMNRLLAYNLLGSLVKGIIKDMPSNFHPQGLNLENASLRELLQSLEKAAMEICASNSLLLNQKKMVHKLSLEIQKYIDTQFRDPNINVSITSYHFRMTPYYLATIFREGTGKNLLEYINTLRVEEGKKLLISGCKVNETAVKCGFRNAGAFIRVFKKFTGVTPGLYKDGT